MSSSSNTVSHSSLLDLKALTAEHAARLDAEGRAAVRGAPRSSAATAGIGKLNRDPFLRPSPGLVARLAREARADAQQRRVFQDDGAGGVDDATRREILEAKARKYDALARGDISGLSERERRELGEATIDFEAKAHGGDWSDHSSDVDESAVVPDGFDTLADTEEVEYVDELGRTRRGTRREAREAEHAASSSRGGRDRDSNYDPHAGSSYAQVLDSQLIHGDQSFFPVYTPDPDALRRKYQEEERLRAAEHYDSTREVRVRGAGAYQFAMGEAERRAQRASLDAVRAETEKARRKERAAGGEGEGGQWREGNGGGGERGSAGLSKAQAARKRRLAERAAVVEAKRVKLLGGAEKVAAARAARTEREAETLLGHVSAALEKE